MDRKILAVLLLVAAGIVGMAFAKSTYLVDVQQNITLQSGTGTGSVTSIIQGFGLNFSVDPITTTGTIGVNLSLIATDAELGSLSNSVTANQQTEANNNATQKALIETKGTGNLSSLGSTGYIPQFQNATTLNNSVIYQNGTDVGIGTEIPTSKLEVIGVIKWGNGTKTGLLSYSTANDNLIIGSATTHSLDFAMNSIRKMRLTVDGDVGINSDNPTARLSVIGTNATTGLSLNINNGVYINGTTNSLGIGTPNPYGLLHISGGKAAGGNLSLNVNSILFVNASTGNVGMNTANPTAKLHVTGAWNGLSMNIDNRLYVNGTSGYVGINTGNPLNTLDMAGGIITRWNSAWTGVNEPNVLPIQNTLAFATSNPAYNVTVWNATGGNLTPTTGTIANMFDGDTGTYASFSYAVLPMYVQVDLDKRYNLGHLWSVGFYSSYYANVTTIEGYDDVSGIWRVVYNTSTNSDDSVSAYYYENYVTRVRFTFDKAALNTNYINIAELVDGNDMDRKGFYAKRNGAQLYGGWTLNGTFNITDGNMTVNGRVGIGTTDPSAKLEVAGNGAGRILMGDMSYANYGGISLTNATTAGNYTFLSRITDDLFINTQLNYGIRFRQNNIDRMFIDSSGNVGIGVVNQAQKLVVNGSANVTGTLFVNGINVTAQQTADNNTLTALISGKANQTNLAGNSTRIDAMALGHTADNRTGRLIGTYNWIYQGTAVGNTTLWLNNSIYQMPDNITLKNMRIIANNTMVMRSWECLANLNGANTILLANASSVNQNTALDSTNSLTVLENWNLTVLCRFKNGTAVAPNNIRVRINAYTNPATT